MILDLNIGFILGLGIALFVVIAIFKTAQIVPQRSIYVIERLGKFNRSLDSGFHLLIPFLDKVAYKHTLKEQVIDVNQQTCVTKDNIEVGVDGVMYLQVIDPKQASYGIDDYGIAAANLAKTTMRSVIGQMELDKTFEERALINKKVMEALDEASNPWGIKMMRYEVSDIELPGSIKGALEMQMKAERERRATIAESEGERQAKINVSEGEMKEMINISEGEKQKQINEAAGRAEEITLIAEATAKGIQRVAAAIQEEGGGDAVNLRVAEQYIEQFGHLAKENNTMILSQDVSDVGSMVASMTNVFNKVSPTVKS